MACWEFKAPGGAENAKGGGRFERFKRKPVAFGASRRPVLPMGSMAFEARGAVERPRIVNNMGFAVKYTRQDLQLKESRETLPMDVPGK